jgi:defect in organelle trafficking protein DotD
MIRHRLVPIGGCFALTLLAGCAAIHVPTTVETPGMPNPERALQQSIGRVDSEMAELGQMNPMASQALAPVVPAELQRVVSFSYSGPIDRAITKLAAAVGYTAYVTAPVNAQPLDVGVDISNITYYDLFRTIGDEAGTHATVVVDPLHHQVQVIHHV